MQFTFQLRVCDLVSWLWVEVGAVKTQLLANLGFKV